MFIFFDFSDLPFLCLHNTYPHPIDWFGSIFLFFKSNPHFGLDFYEFHVIFATFPHVYPHIHICQVKIPKKSLMSFSKMQVFFSMLYHNFALLICRIFTQFRHDPTIISGWLWYISERYATIYCGRNPLTDPVPSKTQYLSVYLFNSFILLRIPVF